MTPRPKKNDSSISNAISRKNTPAAMRDCLRRYEKMEKFLREDLGFSQYMIKAYIGLLCFLPEEKVGKKPEKKERGMKATTLARKTGIPREKIYSTLDELQRYSMVSTVTFEPRRVQTTGLEIFAQRIRDDILDLESALVKTLEETKKIQPMLGAKEMKHPTLFFNKDPMEQLHGIWTNEAEKEFLQMSRHYGFGKNTVTMVKRFQERFGDEYKQRYRVIVNMLEYLNERDKRAIYDAIMEQKVNLKSAHKSLDMTMTIKDESYCLVRIVHPDEVGETIGLAYADEDFARGMKNYFEYMWNKAKKLSLDDPAFKKSHTQME